MANRPIGYGLTAEIRSKMAAKYDLAQEQEARLWIEAVLNDPLVEGSDLNDPDPEPLGPHVFHEVLKDGQVLCRLAQVITGHCKVLKMKQPFKQMENISNFLQACEKYGVSKTDLFQTVDLFENQNMSQVVCCLNALGRRARIHSFDGPTIGPKESAPNRRNFDDEVMRAGEGIIGLQMGTNKCASQKGMVFGKGRHINDLKISQGTQEGHGVIGLQAGTNRGASQKGYAFGSSRGITCNQGAEPSREGLAVPGLQMGSNKGASQAGMRMGTPRMIADYGVETPVEAVHVEEDEPVHLGNGEATDVGDDENITHIVDENTTHIDDENITNIDDEYDSETDSQ